MVNLHKLPNASNICILFISLTLSAPASSVDSNDIDSLLDTLRRQVKELTERVSALESVKTAKENVKELTKKSKKSRLALPKKEPADVPNPNSENHQAFTKLLSHPGLVWAESLRPIGTKKQIDAYYGRRRHGGSGKAPKNPRLSYDATEDAARVQFVEGEKGMPFTYQTRIRFPELGPSNSKTATVRWEYKVPNTGWAGGKQFQIATPKSDLHTEFLVRGKNHGQIPSENWVRLPGLRVYRTVKIGGRGLNDMLVGGKPTKGMDGYCSGIFTCPLQPNLPRSGSSKTLRNFSHHVSGEIFALRPNIWMTIEITFDWRDDKNHKIWMHLSDEETPRTLVVGINGDGYPVEFQKHKTNIGEWWIEFNNSSTINDRNSYALVRNLVVLKDAFPP